LDRLEHRPREDLQFVSYMVYAVGMFSPKKSRFLVAVAILVLIVAVGLIGYHLGKSAPANNSGPVLSANVVSSMSQINQPTSTEPSVVSSTVASKTEAKPANAVVTGSATSLSKVPPPQASVQAATTSMNRAPIVTPLADQTGLFNATVAIVCINPETAGTFGTVNYGTGVKRLHPDQ